MGVKVLMVCLGNICRSPMAHGLLWHKVQVAGLDWQVDSAGTNGWHEGELPDPRAIACMKRHGIDITYQRARLVVSDDLQEFDLIYAMDKAVYDDVVALAQNEEEEQKIKLLMNEVNPGSNADVPDPYYGEDTGFEHVYKLLDTATDKVIEKYSVNNRQKITDTKRKAN